LLDTLTCFIRSRDPLCPVPVAMIGSIARRPRAASRAEPTNRDVYPSEANRRDQTNLFYLRCQNRRMGIRLKND
jgi:hypothetical protein